jgi:hypothetical protein
MGGWHVGCVKLAQAADAAESVGASVIKSNPSVGAGVGPGPNLLVGACVVGESSSVGASVTTTEFGYHVAFQ